MIRSSTRKLLVAFALILAPFCMPKAAFASCATSMSYVFTNGTSALDATTTNANNNQLLSCARNVDNTQIGAAGIYASQIIPTNMTQGTFGGSVSYTIPAGLQVNGNINGGAITTAQADGQAALIFPSDNAAYRTGIGVNTTSGYPYFSVEKLDASNAFQAWLLGIDASGNLNVPNGGGNFTGPVVTTNSAGYYSGTAGAAQGTVIAWGVNNGGFTKDLWGVSNSSSAAGIFANAVGLFRNDGGDLLSVDNSGDLGIGGGFVAGAGISASTTISAGTNITASANLVAGGTLNVTGAATTGSLTTGGIGATSVNDSGALAVGGNAAITGTLGAAATTVTSLTASGTVKATEASGAQGYVGPSFTGAGTTTGSFHYVLLQGTTNTGSTCGPSGSTTNCLSITLPANLAFSGLGTYACGPVNEVISASYQRLKNPINEYPTSSDGRTFFLSSTNASTTVSAGCSGY